MDCGFQMLDSGVNKIPEMDFSEWLPDSLFNRILDSITLHGAKHCIAFGKRVCILLCIPRM